MIFGAMSGASTAAASVMSKVALPNMRRLGYSDVLAAGVVGVGATTDILIPPSVALVIYGIATETSIGKLLIAGVIPGILVCILLIFCIFVWVTIRPSDAPNVQRVPWAERWQSLWRIWACLLLVAIVIVLLYTGVATPTEVGALGAFIAGLIGVIFGRLNWAGTVEAFKGTLRIATMIFLIIIGAYIFGIFITMSRVPDAVINTIIEMNLNRWIVIIGIVVAYFVVSMFMDEIPLLLITLQLTFPLIIKLGFDPIWYGIISMMMVSMGLIFPPVGIIAFIVSAAGNVDLVKVFKGTSILMIATILATVLIMVFPQIALWLPSKMR
jgi:tripartite ATP-independent transporter DctM subunit